ncbi:DUF4198 domain-containing protein [Pararhodonellum marinum]|uniref:DUF4198 domain-containing protein n=1 Tax=Pararhodonellum marinum TaxID=2755358 RepID=UPI001890453D|nr:DUF4198 domain-containing protein [Pararhodonellum marinum]
MRKISLAVLCILLLSGHELFLKTDSYFLTPQKENLLYLFNGTFDLSENTISRDRIVNAQIHGPDFYHEPSDKDYYDDGDITFLRWKTGASGSYVAGISTLPRTLEMSPEDFLAYLEHEGLTGLIAERKEKGLSEKSAKEKYSKHVKALLQVGKQTSVDYSKVLGYPIEFVPLNNPYATKKGEVHSFQLFWKGKPLTDQVVHYAYKVGERDTEGEKSTLTNEEGIVHLQAEQKGKWYLATIFIEESAEAELDYESNWATLTFEVR